MILENDIFHVHTARCGHAEQINDEAYVQIALQLKKSGIWFTDHAPFPDDPFRGRMKYAELKEYLGSLTELQKKYPDFVHIGLEIEYFPSYDKKGYYAHLQSDPRIEFLLLGQHMAEDPDRQAHYTFEWEKGRLKAEEYKALGNAICKGIQAGYFHGVAHPDRIFRRCSEWTEDMENISREIIQAAEAIRIPLEVNVHSRAVKNYYRPGFWHLTHEGTNLIVGLDAHSRQELLRREQRAAELRKSIPLSM